MTHKALYVTQQGARVHIDKGMLSVSFNGQSLDRWPLTQIQRVLLFGNVQITTQALARLLQQGAHLALFSSSGGFRGHLASPGSSNVFLRLQQHARLSDTPFRAALARDLITAKVTQARARILRFRRNHPDAQHALAAPLLRLEEALRRLPEAPDDLDTLRGLEGAAAAAWFQAFAAMVRPPFAFERRSQHPAHNPVNALLNLGYTCLTHEIAGRLEAAGFDPFVGLFHGVRYGRQSLALDLIEPFRVDVIDRMVLALLNRRVFAPEDFYDAGGLKGVRLNHRALKRFLGAFEEALGQVEAQGDTPRSRIEADINALRQRVLFGATGAEHTPAEPPHEVDPGQL